MRFPLGDLTKDEVRKRAAALALPTAAKRDSYGLCYIGKRKFSDFLAAYLDDVDPGRAFVSVVDGSLVGEVPASFMPTVGQRARLSGQPHAWFVAPPPASAVASNWKEGDGDADRSSTAPVYVTPHSKHPALYATTLVATDPLWMDGGAPPSPDRRLLYRLRHGQPLVPCSVACAGSVVTVSLERPQRGIARGQIVAFYAPDGEVVGSAVINAPGPSLFDLGQADVPDTAVA